MKRILTTSLLLLLTAFSGNTLAHGGHDHQAASKDSAKISPAEIRADSTMRESMAEHQQMEAIDAFPNYHPLVIHFPIVLLLMATVFQLLSFFIFKKEFSIATLILLALGVLSAWLASNIFHAHPGALTGKANAIFETHEQMALFTWWFSLAALLVKLSSHFFFERKWWIESVVALLLIASSVTVSIAGHHGAMLVHMEGIGPMGNYLEGGSLVKTNTEPTSQGMTMPKLQNDKVGNKSDAVEEDHHIGETGKGPHGGTIEEADPYHIEMKAEGTDLIFYLLDANAKPVSMKDVTGSLKINIGKSIKKIDLMEMGGKLTAMQANNGQAFTAVCNLIKAGKSYSASFNSGKDLPATK